MNYKVGQIVYVSCEIVEKQIDGEPQDITHVDYLVRPLLRVKDKTLKSMMIVSPEDIKEDNG